MDRPATARRKLYLVDGTAQLFRAYFAIRGLTSPGGLPTNAVFGFTNMLRKLLQEERPTHLAVAFDLEGPTFRHDRFEDYKANRPDAPEDLNVQVPYTKEVCRAFRIPILERKGFEADDLIATFARLGREAGFEVVVVASDKDLLQLVGDGVVNLNPSKEIVLDADGVREEFGVPPGGVRDVLGLMGDSVDNIPGVPGVGEKTAKAMIRAYASLERVLERAARFAAAFAARDRLLERLADREEETDLSGPADELAAGLDRLAEVERDAELEQRWRKTADAIRELPVDDADARPSDLDRPLGKLLRAMDRKTARKTWESVHEHREQAILSRELATLDLQVPVEFDEEDLLVGPPDREAAAHLFAGLGFRRLTEEFSRPEPGEEEGGAASANEPNLDYRAVFDADELRAFLDSARGAGRVAVDTETDSTDPMRAALVGVSLAFRPGEAVYVPVGHRYDDAPAQIALGRLREILGPFLADPEVAKVGQNIKYDLHVLRRHGMPVAGVELDTMVAAFLARPGRASYGMDLLALEYLGTKTIPYEDVAGKGASQKTLDRIDVAEVTRYAAEDADVTLRLAEVLEQRLRESGLHDLYRRLDGPLIPVLAEMERAGIRVDVDKLGAMSEEMAGILDRTRDRIFELAGEEFNVDSPKQLRGILFDKLGLRPGRKTAKGKVHSTDAQTLEQLASDHPIATAILEYRELAKLKSTYADTLPALVHPETGRIHTSYHPTGAATGRLSSSDPNLQNIPARSRAGLRIREAFVPADGHVFLAADYSQVELRVLAHLSGDPGLLEAFRAGEDIHRHTAAKVFGVAPDLVSAEMRRRAKAVNFGILYGMSESRLAREQRISGAEARRFIQAYFDRFAGVRDYIERTREAALRDAAVRTMFGRVRFFPELHQKVGRARQEQALRGAVNTTIQGTAADLMKLSMLRVHEELRRARSGARMLLQVHDELLLEVPEEQIEETTGTVTDAMETVHPMEVPLLVDHKSGANWREVT